MPKSPGPPVKAVSGKTIPCPSCGTPSSGRFCIECGAVVGEVRCSSCGGALTPGAKFCHDCGAAVGAAAARGAAATARPAARPVQAARGNLPWVIAAVAFVVLIVIYAAQRSGESSPSAPAGMGGSAGASAVDIASMSPQERASRLFDRIMRLTEEGKADSAAFFASMAIGVYESLGPLDLDTRYDFGRVAMVGGNLDIAQAQADSIRREAPDHLLGLILAAAVAGARGDTRQRATLERRLIEVENSQQARPLDEYARHKADIDAAIEAARGGRRTP